MNKINDLVHLDINGPKFSGFTDGSKDKIELYGFDEIIKDNRIDIEGDISKEKEIALLSAIGRDSKIKIGRIASLLKLNKRTSYSEALKNKKLNAKEILSGKFDEVYPIIRVTMNVGWHRSSQVAINDENTTFNRWVDSESIEIAKRVILSDNNRETESYPASGMILAIQGLRIKGYTSNQIIGLSKSESLVNEVYMVYNGKLSTPRSGVYGAREIEAMLKKHIKFEDRGKLLGWAI